MGSVFLTRSTPLFKLYAGRTSCISQFPNALKEIRFAYPLRTF